MSRFTGESTEKIYLKNNDWVEVNSNVSYAEFVTLIPDSETNKTEIGKKSTLLLQMALKDWSFEDAKGKKVECTKENIDRLDAATVLELTPIIMALYTGIEQKKNSTLTT